MFLAACLARLTGADDVAGAGKGGGKGRRETGDREK